jgi:hypothetical protein
MAVNLSALAGAGQQFFDNSGVILSGGKLYSYAAGTTTPQTTYTSASGSTAHTNPIVLNSAGRVATGEIWLTAGNNYKFALYTSTDVLIATWDNITGINGTGITTNASSVQYDPAGTGAVATTVQGKLRQTVSVMDFGASPSNTAAQNDTAFANAIAYIVATAQKGVLVIPSGTYNLSSSLAVNVTYVSLQGQSATLDFSTLTTGAALVVSSSLAQPNELKNAITSISGLEIIGNSFTGSVIGIQYTSSFPLSHFSIDNCAIRTFGVGESFETNSYIIHHKDVTVYGNSVGVQNLTGFTNNGENIDYVGGCITGNTVNIVQNNGNGSMFFANTSIDYPGSYQISITAGQLNFVNCHIESYGTTPIFQNNAQNSVTSFTNCWILQNATTGPNPFINISGAVNITGGKLTAGAATSPVVQVNSGGSLNAVSLFIQYTGSNLFNLISGSFYTISLVFPIQLGGTGQFSSFFNNRNVTSSLFVSTGGSFLGGVSTILSVLNTWYSLGTAANNGLYIFRDETLGGKAAFMADSSTGATSLSNNITGFAMNYGGVAGQMSIQVTAGAVPRSIRWTLLQTGF